jgi:hypothetical protein
MKSSFIVPFASIILWPAISAYAGAPPATPPSVQEVAANILATLDANHDGQLSLEECNVLCPDVERVFLKMFDHDGNNIVTVEELESPWPVEDPSLQTLPSPSETVTVASPAAGSTSSSADVSRKNLAQTQFLLRKFDQNKNRRLDKAEAARARVELSAHPASFSAFFDMNKNGRIDAPELRTIRRSLSRLCDPSHS